MYSPVHVSGTFTLHVRVKDGAPVGAYSNHSITIANNSQTTTLCFSGSNGPTSQASSFIHLVLLLQLLQLGGQEVMEMEFW